VIFYLKGDMKNKKKLECLVVFFDLAGAITGVVMAIDGEMIVGYL